MGFPVDRCTGAGEGVGYRCWEGSPESFRIPVDRQAQQTHNACPRPADKHCGLLIYPLSVPNRPTPSLGCCVMCFAGWSPVRL